jgi:hypothetical protein
MVAWLARGWLEWDWVGVTSPLYRRRDAYGLVAKPKGHEKDRWMTRKEIHLIPFLEDIYE